MSLTTTPCKPIHLVVRGLAGILVDTSRVNDDAKVRVLVRVLHDGLLLGESPLSHPLRATGNVVYSLQRHVAAWSQQRNEKPLLLEAGQKVKLEVCLQLQNGESWRIGSGDWEVAENEQEVSDVEIVCSLSNDKKDSSPYRIDPTGDAVLRVAGIALKEKRPSLVQDPPGAERTSGPVEPPTDLATQSPIKVLLEQSISPVKVIKENPSPKKRNHYSSQQKPIPFFPSIFGGSKKGKLKVRGQNRVTATPSPKARATIISSAPIILSLETTSPQIVHGSQFMHSVDNTTDEISFVWHGSPLRKNANFLSSDLPQAPHTPSPQSTRPVTVSPDPPERSVLMRVSPEDNDMSSSSSSEEDEADEIVHLLDDHLSPELSATLESGSPVDFKVKQTTAMIAATTPFLIAKKRSPEVDNAALSETSMTSFPQRILVPSLARTDQIDHDESEITPQQGCSLTCDIPDTSDCSLSCNNHNSNVDHRTSPSLVVASYPELILDSPTCVLTPTLSQMDDNRVAAALEEACSLAHGIPEPSDCDLFCNTNTDGGNEDTCAATQYPEVTPESLASGFVPPLSQTGQIDRDKIANMLQEEVLSNHSIPETNDSSLKNSNVKNKRVQTSAQPAPETVGLVWDIISPGSSTEECDDSEVTIESLATPAENAFHLSFAFENNKDTIEEGAIIPGFLQKTMNHSSRLRPATLMDIDQ